MNPVEVVVVDLGVNSLNEFPGSIKTINIAKFIFEMTKEGFFVSVLPRGCFGGNRYLYAMEFEVIRHHFCHEFCSLIGVEICGDTPRNEECVFNNRDDERSIMIFAHVGREDLAGCQILNRRQIPKLSLKFEVRHITDPDEVRNKLFLWNTRNQVGVDMVVRGDGTEVVVFSPRCLDSVQFHHPFRAFVVDLEMECHFVLTVRRVVDICLVDALYQILVFSGLYGMTVDILPGDPESICPDGFDAPSGDQLNFFSPDSNQG